MRSRIFLLMLLLLDVRDPCRIEASTPNLDERNLARNFFITDLVTRLVNQRLLIDGHATREKSYGLSRVEARGKKIRQMNKTLMALVIAYTMKFLFLIPTLIGTLILLKFTVGVAGFFYALFAAVLGLDHKQHHH